MSDPPQAQRVQGAAALLGGEGFLEEAAPGAPTDERGRCANTCQREFQAREGGGHCPTFSNVPPYRETHSVVVTGTGDIFSPSMTRFNQTMENSETNTQRLSLFLSLGPFSCKGDSWQAVTLNGGRENAERGPQ